MKKQALFTLFLLFTSQVVLATPVVTSQIADLVESSGLKKSELGLVLQAPTGEMIYELNGNKKFIPASVTKMITGAAVLEKMPVGYQFLTELRTEKSQIQKGVLVGDLYLRGGGDAGFVSESMWFLVNEFTRAGIKEIQGHVIVDDSRFDAVRFDPSRDQSRVDRAYDSPIGAMTFNWSAVNIFVRPGLKAGDPARVFADPENDYFRIINKTKTVSSAKTKKISVSNTSVKKGSVSDEGTEEVEVSGEIGLQADEFVAYKSVTQPEIWAGVQLVQFLKQRGIKVRDGVRRGVAPSSAVVVAQYKSRPIAELVASMMKFSNNYVAEILTKNLGAEKKGLPGTMEKGVDVIRDYMKEKGMNDSELYNPSGLSRKNKFTPRDVLNVLSSVKHSFRVYPEFLSSLPISGVDGTLKRHLGGRDEYDGHVRAKTGHLAGVSGLSGFISGEEGQIYSFVFLFNGTPGDDPYRAKDLFDKIILKVLKQQNPKG